jgi:hypothetical protein
MQPSLTHSAAARSHSQGPRWLTYTGVAFVHGIASGCDQTAPKDPAAICCWLRFGSSPQIVVKTADYLATGMCALCMLSARPVQCTRLHTGARIDQRPTPRAGVGGCVCSEGWGVGFLSLSIIQYHMTSACGQIASPSQITALILTAGRRRSGWTRRSRPKPRSWAIPWVALPASASSAAQRLRDLLHSCLHVRVAQRGHTIAGAGT